MLPWDYRLIHRHLYHRRNISIRFHCHRWNQLGSRVTPLLLERDRLQPVWKLNFPPLPSSAPQTHRSIPELKAPSSSTGLANNSPTMLYVTLNLNVQLQAIPFSRKWNVSMQMVPSFAPHTRFSVALNVKCNCTDLLTGLTCAGMPTTNWRVGHRLKVYNSNTRDVLAVTELHLRS